MSLCALAVAALTIGFAVSAASAADVGVGVAGCGADGQVTRPAGSTVTLRFGVYQKSKGVALGFLRSQATSISVNGGPEVDISEQYGAPVLQPDGTWTTYVVYPTGITLALPGDTLTFSFRVVMDSVFAEVTNGLAGFALGSPILWPRGSTYFASACTVMAV